MKTIEDRDQKDNFPEILPVIPTVDVVVFPHMIVPLLVLDAKIIKGIQQSVERSKLVLLLAAKQQVNNLNTIGTKDLHDVGTIASIMRVIKIPEGGIKILVQGICKARAIEVIASDNNLQATVEPFKNVEEKDVVALASVISDIKIIAENLSGSGGAFSPDFHLILSKMNDPEKIIDFILSHLVLSVEQAQELLEKTSQAEILAKLHGHLMREVEVSQLQERIKSDARESMNKAQKEFYLREQIRVIKKELGEEDDQEIDDLYNKLAQLDAPESVKTEIKRHIQRLSRTAPESMEATVTHNYLDWIFSLPWNIETEDRLDIDYARKILDAEHHGLKKIKERILDFISIRKLKQDGYAPILCFVGPPGTGKTSLGKSIAKSLGRKYARISLGGVKDEAEIRGHRRTYVGAMPGRFIQALKKAGSCNPLIVIDELDKIGADFRGDPSAAMLEVLDPQQNKTFHDNYLGIPFDLSKVMFVATANNLDTISEPLRDRLEIIELSGYILEEKITIAKKHLLERAINDSGLSDYKVDISDAVLKDIITSYTKEAGVRQFERIIRRLCSKAARSIVENDTIIKFDSDNIEKYLGPRKFMSEDALTQDLIGITNGLAWTPYGGEIIKIEAVLMSGKGKLILTGHLGNVMKESAQAALSYARVHAKEFGIDKKMFTNHDLHIHVPAGGVPKDGPSAGITMLLSILSVLTQRPINSKYAMTGELNLCGEVMPIGGVREKILAAQRSKVPHVILPYKNKNDLVDCQDLITSVEVILVKTANEAIDRVLLPAESKNKPSAAKV